MNFIWNLPKRSVVDFLSYDSIDTIYVHDSRDTRTKIEKSKILSLYLFSFSRIKIIFSTMIHLLFPNHAYAKWKQKVQQMIIPNAKVNAKYPMYDNFQ